MRLIFSSYKLSFQQFLKCNFQLKLRHSSAYTSDAGQFVRKTLSKPSVPIYSWKCKHKWKELTNFNIEWLLTSPLTTQEANILASFHYSDIIAINPLIKFFVGKVASLRHSNSSISDEQNLRYRTTSSN